MKTERTLPRQGAKNVCLREHIRLGYGPMAAKNSKKVTAKKTTKKKPGAVTSAAGAADRAIKKKASKKAPRNKSSKKAVGERQVFRGAKKKASKAAVGAEKKAVAGGPVLLSGGNPQIAKADGDAPVQAYIAAMPGWKSDVGRRLDVLIVKAVPTIRKAVKWNSPFYGLDGKGWFLSFHCFNKYVKVAFLFGRSLTPMPPGESKDPNARYLDIYEEDELDEARFTSWVRQGAEGPGWTP